MRARALRPSLAVNVQAAARDDGEEQNAADHQHHHALHPILMRRKAKVESAGSEGERDFVGVMEAPQRHVCETEVTSWVV